VSERIAYSFLETPWCELTVATSARGVCLVEFGRSLARAQAAVNGYWGRAEWKESKSANRELAEQLREYFHGQRKEFALPLDLRGQPFQLRAWRALTRIPYGQTRTYKQVAAAAGSPGAYRAAGTACGSNRVAIVIPCHRVVGSDGSLTGFGGGLALKEKLLALEADGPVRSVVRAG